jgi:hypothetical protein
MKLKYYLILIFILFFHSLFSQNNTSGKAEIIFETNTHNFKNLELNNEYYFDFIFKNTGNSPLVISKIETSCGCTTAEKPEAPINTKEKKHIRVWYNSETEGKFNKTITVYSNAENSPTQLFITGEVSTKKNITNKTKK